MSHARFDARRSPMTLLLVSALVLAARPAEAQSDGSVGEAAAPPVRSGHLTHPLTPGESGESGRPPPGLRNLLINGGFEGGPARGMAGWRTLAVGRVELEAPQRNRRPVAAPTVGSARTGQSGVRISHPEGAELIIAVGAYAIPTQPGRAYRFEAWMRPEGDLEAYPGAPGLTVMVRFLDERKQTVLVDGARQIYGEAVTEVGTWAKRQIEVTVPEGARYIKPAIVLGAQGQASVDDARLLPLDAPTFEVVEGEVYRFHHLPGDPISEADRQAAETRARTSAERLGLPVPRGIDYFKYPDRDTKVWLTGWNTSAHHVLAEGAAPAEVHSVLPSDGHVVVHLLTETHVAARRATPPFLSEGLAVALDGHWEGEDPVRTARALRGARALPSVTHLISTPANFDAGDPRITHVVAGAFVTWLLERHGMEAFLKVYDMGTDIPAQTVQERFEAVYGSDLLELERLWRTSLGM
jgi:hypothetical protein